MFITEKYNFVTKNTISLQKIQIRTPIYENITSEMKSSVSVMNLITVVIKKFITECVNSFQLKGPISGCANLCYVVSEPLKFSMI